MPDFELLPSARVEYADAFQWYAGQSLIAAERFAVEIEAAFEAIRRNPELYPRWNDVYHFYLLKKFPYFIAYRQANGLVVVVAIRHTSQDQDVWKGR
jgi:plasmid stabilization system protein ParE